MAKKIEIPPADEAKAHISRIDDVEELDQLIVFARWCRAGLKDRERREGAQPAAAAPPAAAPPASDPGGQL